jgi:hypothetical protein
MRIIRQGSLWGVKESHSDSDVLAKFEDRDDAFDYARYVAIGSRDFMLECEDEHGRLDVRQMFSTDSTGVIRVTSIDLSAAGYLSGLGNLS